MAMQQVTPHFAVSDIATSVQFYRDILGFTVGYVHSGNDLSIERVILEKGNVEIILTDRAVVERMPEVISGIGASQAVHILSDGVEDFFANICSRVRVIAGCGKTFFGTKEFRIADPDGYILAFFEEAG